MDVTIYPSKVWGRCAVPPSKSHTMRAILLGSLAHGESLLDGVLLSPDTDAMVAACRRLGASLDWHEGRLVIKGTSGRVSPQGEIDCGNSGQVLRFVAALGALGERSFTITGDASIRDRRPVNDLIGTLQQGGVSVTSFHGRPPLQIRGPLHPGTFRMRGHDSQPVSALLMACACMNHPSTILVTHLGERPWVGLTVWWLRRLGAIIDWQEGNGLDRFEVSGRLEIDPIQEQIPGDWSSAAFPIVAGLLTGRVDVSTSLDDGIRVDGLLPHDPQGDKGIVAVLQNMGARISWKEDALWVRRSSMRGGRLDANAIIDAVPILAAAGPFMERGIHVENIAMARRKESDRLDAMAEGLRRLGARVSMGEDWIRVLPGALQGGEVCSHQDHRIAMALSVAALGALAPVTVCGCECVAKSYPGFFTMLQDLGATLRVEEAHEYPVKC